MDIFEFAGTHAEVGRQHGEQLRERLTASIEKRMERCVRASRAAGNELSVEQVRGLAGRCLSHLRAFSPGLTEELEGIAAAAGGCLEDVFLAAGYTDVVDVVRRAGAGAFDAGCTALWAGPEATVDASAFVGQTWDMFAEAIDDVLALRIKVDGEPELICLSYAGCVGMMGANAEGVVLAANNLRPNNARPGVPWVFQCRAILAQKNAEDAFAAMRKAHLCSGHNFLIADGTGAAMSIETTGEQYLRIDPAGSVFAHANHYLAEAGRQVELPASRFSCSPHRHRRMQQLLDAQIGRIDRAYLERSLADRDGDPRCISSSGYAVGSGAKVATCAAIIANATTREVALVHGPPSAGDFQTVRL